MHAHCTHEVQAPWFFAQFIYHLFVLIFSLKVFAYFIHLLCLHFMFAPEKRSKPLI